MTDGASQSGSGQFVSWCSHAGRSSFRGHVDVSATDFSLLLPRERVTFYWLPSADRPQTAKYDGRISTATRSARDVLWCIKLKFHGTIFRVAFSLHILASMSIKIVGRFRRLPCPACHEPDTHDDSRRLVLRLV